MKKGKREHARKTEEKKKVGNCVCERERERERCSITTVGGSLVYIFFVEMSFAEVI
jgi:hypothetical protein